MADSAIPAALTRRNFRRFMALFLGWSQDKHKSSTRRRADAEPQGITKPPIACGIKFCFHLLETCHHPSEKSARSMTSVSQNVSARAWKPAATACWRFVLFLLIWPLSARIIAQPLGEPDRAQAGDPGIQEYLRQETERIEADFLGAIHSAEDWNRARPTFL